MCVVSMVMDHYYDKWQGLRGPIYPIPMTAPVTVTPEPAITSEEIREFRILLERAREYDRKNNQPDCEMEEKRQKLLTLAKDLGVEIQFV